MKLRDRLPRRLVEPMSAAGIYVDIRAGAPNEARERRRQRAILRQSSVITPPPRDTITTPAVRAASQLITNGNAATITATCSAGEVVTGCGCYAGNGPTFSTSCRSCYPNTPNQECIGMINNSSGGSVTATVYAICTAAKLGTE